MIFEKHGKMSSNIFFLSLGHNLFGRLIKEPYTLGAFWQIANETKRTACCMDAKCATSIISSRNEHTFEIVFWSIID
jgi:hypothetical protein